MKTIAPTALETERLILRQPEAADIPAIVRHAGDPRVALKTSVMPHPYFASHAHQWLAEVTAGRANRSNHTFAIERKADPGMIGVISLEVREDRCSAEAGYWLGVKFWRKGFMTEALRRILDHGFGELGLLYITAGHMAGNPASGRVMTKAGMKFENIVEGGITRAGIHYERVNYGLFADEWHARKT
ncbi:GNAT family N-acetyltransferase [Luteolibacter marinus]|uniref:GNAT family N-acetyltransferase n=1 Tax=Luteolibacter marinus TaxID=2776705 RepID=UPI0018680D8E|nr:GNAT family N-acetyltransferase [Luteolibacter marinus]